jgi:hypothetical protein
MAEALAYATDGDVLVVSGGSIGSAAPCPT